MILCVTLNPCVDKTLVVPAWAPGQNVRGRSVSEIVGGKGNNVARALRRLGHRAVRPVLFLGGQTGERCERLLRSRDRLEPIVVRTAAETRVILTVRTSDTAEQSAFFDPDPAITSAEAGALVKCVSNAFESGAIDAITLSGSSPAPATHGVYRDLIELANTRDIPIFVDTYGPALAAIGERGPGWMQLNRREAETFRDRAFESDAEVVDFLAARSSAGRLGCVVTNGPEPAIAMAGSRRFRLHPPEVRVVNPIGCGDCFLAGVVDGFLSGRDAIERLRRGVAAAAANATIWDAGEIDPDMVARLEPHVRIDEF